MLPIANITQENPHVKTFWFDYPLKSAPGQFVMLWLPGIDQKPFSISYDNETQFGLTIFAVGNMTQTLFNAQVRDKVGITGPYGNPFSIKEYTHYIMVAGGYGAGPLGLLAEAVQDKHCTVDFCVGARNADLLLFETRMAALPHVRVHVSTDDGSKGHTGYVTDMLEQQLRAHQNNSIQVATCGPEPMEVTVLNLCNQFEVDCEISIERYMKCGFNVCGQCCVDGLGIPMCSVGPVVSRKVANTITEFGTYHRNKAGNTLFY